MTATPLFRRAFTLIEMLIVIGVMGILLSLLLSAVQSARGAAARVACQNHLKQIALAMQMYHNDRAAFPAAHSELEGVPGSSVSWTVRLLPYFEQDSLGGQAVAAIRQTRNTTADPPHGGLKTVVKVLTCPADSRLSTAITDDRGYTAAYGSFQGVSCGGCVSGRGFNGAMPGFRGVSLSGITDGTSNTLLVGERPPWGRYLSGAWYTGVIPDPVLVGNPNWAGGGVSSMDVINSGEDFGCRGPVRYGPGRINNRCDVLHFWSLHSGGANFAFCDGSVRFLPYSAEPIMVPLATRAGGESVSLD